MNNQDLQQQLLEAFKIEAEERITSMFDNLTALEKNADPEIRRQKLEIVYREAHSLKGAARSVNIIPVESLYQEMESLFSSLKNEKIRFEPEIFDTLHHAVGMIEKYLSTPEQERQGLENSLSAIATAVSEQKEPKKNALQPPPETQPRKPAPKEFPQPALEVARTDHPTPSEAETDAGSSRFAQPPASRAGFTDTVRISAAKLDSLLLKSEELITVKQLLSQHLKQINGTRDSIRQWKKISETSQKHLQDVRLQLQDRSLLDRFFQLYELAHDQIEETSGRINELSTSMEQSNRVLGAMVDELLEEMKKTSLLPFSRLFSLLPRMAREISRDMGKDVDLEISGGDIEIDKRILEGLKDPFIHLIRNAIDHGIETPETRKRKLKPSWGKTRITVAQPESHKVEMIVADDGAGIDIPALKTKALKTGVISAPQAEALTDDEALSLIFHSGISTSPMITEISGRGLGMAIVQKHIENLSGLIFVSSRPDAGTTIKIELPVSLATFKGIIVSASGHDFILPIAHMDHSLRIEPEDIRTAENRTIISVNGQAMSLVSLSDILGLPPRPLPDTPSKKDTLPVIILGSGDKTIACIVDQISSEQEVLVKSLGRQLKKIPNISGATILGNGQVVPILNVNDLISTASGRSISFAMAKALDAKKHPLQKSVLIVEDSFTSRTLLKNILESSGYRVSTAIDGEDGFQQLKTRDFDAVVSDVEMPKMNGFELTQKIRGDDVLSRKPVVLVTGLDSREDREKGVDAGADAYIVKTSFDQSNLLEVLARLV